MQDFCAIIWVWYIRSDLGRVRLMWITGTIPSEWRQKPHLSEVKTLIESLDMERAQTFQTIDQGAHSILPRPWVWYLIMNLSHGHGTIIMYYWNLNTTMLKSLLTLWLVELGWRWILAQQVRSGSKIPKSALLLLDSKTMCDIQSFHFHSLVFNDQAFYKNHSKFHS